MHYFSISVNPKKRLEIKKNPLGGRRGGGDWIASWTWRGTRVIWDIRFVKLENKWGCHSSQTATSWTKHVHNKMLEQTRMNHTCKRVLGITGAGILSHRTGMPSDLTSISLLHTTSPSHRLIIPKNWQWPNSMYLTNYPNFNSHSESEPYT